MPNSPLYSKLLREREIESRLFREHAIKIGLFRARPWTDGDLMRLRAEQDAEKAKAA